MDRKATAVWTGTIQQGAGVISSESGVLRNAPYSFSTRFEEERGTNPEELIAAAHAACFAMATSGNLTKNGYETSRLEVTATVSIQKKEHSWEVRSSHLELRAEIPGIDAGQFNALAEDAKENCPISKLLRAEITLDASLKSLETQAELGF